MHCGPAGNTDNACRDRRWFFCGADGCACVDIDLAFRHHRTPYSASSRDNQRSICDQGTIDSDIVPHSESAIRLDVAYDFNFRMNQQIATHNKVAMPYALIGEL